VKVLQHIRGHGSAEGVGHDNDSVEVVGREDLRDGETGRLIGRVILESSVDDDLCLAHEHEPENFPISI